MHIGHCTHKKYKLFIIATVKRFILTIEWRKEKKLLEVRFFNFQFSF